ncbi:hypothetical protein AB0B79_37940, partial [Streptomyces sp. NPDC039022]|uniref:hypothetical protein n=1 Tax=Streptomyces sp. NPDC039022 TaxID=3157091 RepID=UPI0033F5C3E7
HHDVDKKTARKRAVEMLDRVGIPQPDKRVDDPVRTRRSGPVRTGGRDVEPPTRLPPRRTAGPYWCGVGDQQPS